MKYFSFFIFFCLVGFGLSVASPALASPADLQLYGWAWSDDTGWIKLNNCDVNPNTGVQISPCDAGSSTYSVSADSSTHLVTGYAWSPNVGWIKFGSTSAACGGSAKDAKLVAGSGNPASNYTLTGAAQVVSPTQSPWDVNSANGNWNGCIYFDNASTPGIPGGINFGVVFNPFGAPANGVYSATNTSYGWNAGGASGLSFGGLSWIRFGTTFSNTYVKVVNVGPTLTMNAPSGWSTTCKNTSGAALSQSVTISWTVSNATSCTWTAGGSGAAASSDGTHTQTFTLGPTSVGYNFAMTCTDGTNTTPTASTFLNSCVQCSNTIDDDNDPLHAIDFADPSCHETCKITGLYHPESNNEGANTASPFNCTSGGTVKGVPNLNEN